jgi:hypothetical protein
MRDRALLPTSADSRPESSRAYAASLSRRWRRQRIGLGGLSLGTRQTARSAIGSPALPRSAAGHRAIAKSRAARTSCRADHGAHGNDATHAGRRAVGGRSCHPHRRRCGPWLGGDDYSMTRKRAAGDGPISDWITAAGLGPRCRTRICARRLAQSFSHSRTTRQSTDAPTMPFACRVVSGQFSEFHTRARKAAARARARAGRSRGRSCRCPLRSKPGRDGSERGSEGAGWDCHHLTPIGPRRAGSEDRSLTGPRGRRTPARNPSRSWLNTLKCC